MLNIGIIGATGYAGAELARLLAGHPHVRVKFLGSRSYAGQKFGDIYENFRPGGNGSDGLGGAVCSGIDLEAASGQCDCVFLSLPHGIASAEVTEGVLSRTKVIDLGADFRLSDTAVYEKWYNTEHKGGKLLSKAVYGLCETNRENIRDSRLVANPGCYATCAILALWPLLEAKIVSPEDLIIDAKSGVSGAGRAAELGSLFCEADETVKAYKILSHRHTPEIGEQLGIAAGGKVSLIFTPHLIPMNRGILATCYAKLNGKRSYGEILEAYRARYGGENFVRLTKPGVFPETRWVKGSNFCDIGFAVDEENGWVVAVSALDNLVKGAAGQAVQNMNLMFGLDERTGLEAIPAFPC
ncbi:MAG: N-acetyl-gamma-glutamyl-phosphate reductase [Firmicutes bacterium]|nr:N-acetyl-gamma-glutamyl-phosphate reductase [Bacillota bacterium]